MECVKELIDLKCLLLRRKLKVKDVAQCAGVNNSTASLVLSGKAASQKVDRALAEMLGLELVTVQRITRRGRRNEPPAKPAGVHPSST